jgi:hypothetical protein
MALIRHVVSERKISVPRSIPPDRRAKDNTAIRYFFEYFFTMATPAKIIAMAISSRNPKGSR